MARFMLLIRGGQEYQQVYAAMPPEQMQRALQQYFDWSDKLRAEGSLVSSDELADGGKTVRARNGELVIDGPYAETKDAIGGYYLVEATNEDAAAEIAKGCPALGHGGFVEVRGIVDHSA